MSPGTPLSAPKKVAPSPELRARASEPPQGTAWPPSEKRSLSRRGRGATQESKPRRPKGTGSVYVRDGIVIEQYEVRTPDGRIGRKYVRGKDKKEVAGRLAKAIADRDSGLVYDSGRTTVGEYLDGWLDAIRGTLRERTWRRHEEIARIHLKPSLGKTRLAGLNAIQIQSLYRRKLDSGLSPRTVQMVHLTLHKALKQAVKWMLIPNNIAEAVDPPRPAAKEVRPLDAGQVKKLLVAARGDKLEALYVLAVTTGLRQGELLGLKWGDVDLRGGKLRVRRTVFNGAINPPKTAKSNRSVRLTKEAVRLLASRPRERVVVPHPCRDPYKLPQPYNFLGSPRQQGSSPFLTPIDTQ